jgi:hypothetical protein
MDIPEEERDDFGRREVAMLVGLLLVSGVAGWVDAGDGAAETALDVVAVVAGSAFWVLLLWLVFGRGLMRRRRTSGSERQ